MIVSVVLGVLVFGLGLLGVFYERENLFTYQYFIQMMASVVFLLTTGGHYLPLVADRVYSLLLLPIFIVQLAAGLVVFVMRQSKVTQRETSVLEIFKW